MVVDRLEEAVMVDYAQALDLVRANGCVTGLCYVAVHRRSTVHLTAHSLAQSLVHFLNPCPLIE